MNGFHFANSFSEDMIKGTILATATLSFFYYRKLFLFSLMARNVFIVVIGFDYLLQAFRKGDTE